MAAAAAAGERAPDFKIATVKKGQRRALAKFEELVTLELGHTRRYRESYDGFEEEEDGARLLH